MIKSVVLITARLQFCIEFLRNALLLLSGLLRLLLRIFRLILHRSLYFCFHYVLHEFYKFLRIVFI